MGRVHIYAPPVMWKGAQRVKCSSCGQRAVHVVFGYEYHGPDRTCLSCGENWKDGERMPRPFRRNWRAARVNSARERFRRVLRE